MERCFFKVLIKGEEKNILEFLDALQEKHKSFCIGNAAYDVEVTRPR